MIALLDRARASRLAEGTVVLVALTLVLACLRVIETPFQAALALIALGGLAAGLFLLHRHGLSFVLAVVMVSSLLSRYEIPIGGYTVRPEHITGVLAFLILIVVRLAKRRKPLRVDWTMVLMLSWVGINGVASYANAPNPRESYTPVFRMIILAMILLTVANRFDRSRRQWLTGLRLWLKLGVLESLFGIVVWIAAKLGQARIGLEVNPRLSFLSLHGTLLERDIFGSFVGSIFLMLFFVLMQQRRHRREVLFPNQVLIFGLVISGFAVAISYVRAAWVASLIGVALVYLWPGRRFRVRLARMLVLGMFVLAIATVIAVLISVSPSNWSLVNRIRTFGNLAQDRTWQPRVEENLQAVSDWLKHPFIGNGTASFAQIHGMVRGRPAWIGNLFLHTLVDTGFVGLAIQVLLFGRILYAAMRSSRKTASVQVSTGLSALSVGMVVLLIAYQATDATWFAAFWVQLGLMEAGNRFAGAARDWRAPLDPQALPDQVT